MKTIEAGEMYGFRVINIFPEASTEDEWADFADAMYKILNKKELENTVSA